MNYCWYDEDGVVKQVSKGISQQEALDCPLTQIFNLANFTGPLIRPDELVVINGQLRQRPEKPAIYSAWDPKLKDWIDPRTEEDIVNEELIKLSFQTFNIDGFELNLYTINDLTNKLTLMDKDETIEVQQQILSYAELRSLLKRAQLFINEEKSKIVNSSKE